MDLILLEASDQSNYPSVGQVLPFLFARGLLLTKEKLESKLQRLRGEKKSDEGATERRAQLAALARAPEAQQEAPPA